MINPEYNPRTLYVPRDFPDNETPVSVVHVINLNMYVILITQCSINIVKESIFVDMVGDLMAIKCIKHLLYRRIGSGGR